MRRGFRALVVLLTASMGCAESAAFVSRPNGPPLEGEIDSSDASTLRLRGAGGNLVELSQSEVSDIDHPGNVLAGIGLGLAAGSALSLLPFYFPRSRRNDGPGGLQGLGIFIDLAGIA